MGAQKGNNYALGNNGGHPPKYNSKETLIELIDGYFETEKEKPTISGLAHHLGFISRQSIYDYEKKKEFTYIIKRAVLKIESIHEKGLHGNSNAGHIFWLKNRGWKDTQHVDQNTQVEIIDKTDLGLP